LKQKRGWQRLYENLRKIQTGYERIPGFFQKRIVNTVLICMVLLYCGCTFGMAEKSTGFVLWTIYLVLCGFGYAGYIFYLAVTGAYEIVELEKIEMTRQLDKVYRLDHAVTKTQKVILSAFDMDWNYVKYRAENISRILKGVQ
jgi:hypothetical protein